MEPPLAWLETEVVNDVVSILTGVDETEPVT